jgi:uncharacterized protein YbjT (DUF2867 family)
MKNKRVCILGGTGFVGHRLVNALSSAGWECRVPIRYPERHRGLRLIPGCRPVAVDGFDAGSLATAMEGCGTLVNLAGILNECGGRTFEGTHVALVQSALGAAKEVGVSRYLHMSALNADADKGPSRYLRTKGRGEAIALAAGLAGIAATSFRPSVIFGRGDSFFNRFAGLLRTVPGPFPLACPNARFAPVYVGDVAQAMVRTIDLPDAVGRSYELCGPRVFSLRALVEYTADCMGRKVRVIPLPDGLARLQARVLERLPGKPFSMDNYLSLQAASVCSRDGLRELGVVPTDVDAVVPTYLGRG